MHLLPIPLRSKKQKQIPAPISTESRNILSPLPGVIIDVLVKKGDKISIGQKVAILEAMKMENNIESDIEGVVIDVKVNKGDSVMQGDVIVVIG